MSFSCFNNCNFDYNALVNKPQIGGVVLAGDMRWEDLGIIPVVEAYTQQYAECCIFPTVDSCLDAKQNCLAPGCGIHLDEQDVISVAPDAAVDQCSENAVMNCAVSCMCGDIYCCIDTKQDCLEAGDYIKLEGCNISVCVDTAMSCTSTNPVMNCVVNAALYSILACGYQPGNGIQMNIDCCGCYVISIADCVCVPCDLEVTRNATVNGFLQVNGDIYQCGSAYCTHAEEVYSKCDCIFLRDGTVSPMPEGTYSGLVALYYNGSACAIIAVDSCGTWRLGETDGDPFQPIATRSETCCTTDKALAVWNCQDQCFETAACQGQQATWDCCVEASLCCSCSPNAYKIKGEVLYADKIAVHSYQSFNGLEQDISRECGKFSRYDNVSGVSSESTECNVYCWAQEGCCLSYSRLEAGSSPCAETCQVVQIPMDGSAPTATETMNTGYCNKYGMLFEDDFGYSLLSLCSCDILLCDEMETYTGASIPTLRCICMASYTPNTSGSEIDGAYSAADFTSDPMRCVVCVSCLCYTLDDLGSYCSDCSYYCYCSGDLTYCPVSIDEQSYVPATYYFRHEASCSMTESYDLYYGCGGTACPVCVCCFTQGGCQQICRFRVYRNISFGETQSSCQETFDTMCVVYTFCTPITSVNNCIVEENEKLSICESPNGCSYLVHSYGEAGVCVQQERVKDGSVDERHCCSSCGCWTNWRQLVDCSYDPSSLSAQSGTAVAEAVAPKLTMGDCLPASSSEGDAFLYVGSPVIHYACCWIKSDTFCIAAGCDIWTDGTDMYYSGGSGGSNSQFRLNKITRCWDAVSWNCPCIKGCDIWTDGTDMYFDGCYGTNCCCHLKLDKSTHRWESKSWNFDICGRDIWTDGTDTYYSAGNTYQFKLNKATGIWEKKSWNCVTICGCGIWTDGVDIYYSNGSSDQSKLNKATGCWANKTWNCCIRSGSNVWTDGLDVYYSCDTCQFKLNKSTGCWANKTWHCTIQYGKNIWTDNRTGTYYSASSCQLALPWCCMPSKGHLYQWQSGSWTDITPSAY